MATLDQLYDQQRNEQDGIMRARDKAWQALQDKHEALKSAMGGEKGMYPEQKKQMAKDLRDFKKEWHSETGKYTPKALEQRHKDERAENITGQKPDRETLKKQMIEQQKAFASRNKTVQKKQEPTKQKQETPTKTLSPTEAKKQQMIQEQKAITAKSQSKSKRK